MSEKRQEPKRPLPNPKEYDTREFWKATVDHKLTYQTCDDCGTVVFFPRAHCSGCLSAKLTWNTASGRGTVYSYSIVRLSYHPFFRGKVPYAVAWIDLDEGPRLLSNVVEVDNPLEDVKIGMAVEVVWETHEELSVPLFRPVST